MKCLIGLFYGEEKSIVIKTINDSELDVSTVMKLNLDRHSIENDDFKIMKDRLFKVHRLHKDLESHEDAINKKITEYSRMGMFPNHIFLSDGKIFIEIEDALAICLDKTTELMPFFKNLKNRYICFYDEFGEIILLKDTKNDSNNYKDVA